MHSLPQIAGASRILSELTDETKAKQLEMQKVYMIRFSKAREEATCSPGSPAISWGTSLGTGYGPCSETRGSAVAWGLMCA